MTTPPPPPLSDLGSEGSVGLTGFPGGYEEGSERTLACSTPHSESHVLSFAELSDARVQQYRRWMLKYSIGDGARGTLDERGCHNQNICDAAM